MGERRWYRLHWGTWVAVLAVVGVLASCQFEERVFAIFRTRSDSIYIDGGYGWPCFVLFDDRDGPTAIMPNRWHGPSVKVHQLLNVIASLVVVAATGFVVERWARSSRTQIRLGTLFGFIAVIAVLFGLHRLNQTTNPENQVLPLYGAVVIPSPMLVGEIPWAVRLPFLFGLGCTIYSAGWLVGSVTSRAMQGVCRCFRRSAKPAGWNP